MQPTISKKEIWTMGSYSLLTLSIMVGFMYLNTFATEVLQISAATLATALLVAKTMDFIFSVVHGAVIEKVKLPGNKGKNASWLYYGRWVVALCAMLEVTNTTMAPVMVRVLVLSVSYIVLNCMMNILQTSYYGLVAVIGGPNPANRNAMTVNMIRQTTVVTLVCAFIPTLVTVLPFGSWNYFVVSLVFVIPMPFALGSMAKLAEGRDLPVGAGPAGAPQISVKDMVESLFKNPQLLILFLAHTVMYIAMYMYQANYTYYFIYVVGDFTKMTVANLVASVVGFFAAMFMPKFGAKLGKKWASVVGYAAFALVMIGIYFACNVAGGNLLMYTVLMTTGTAFTYTYSAYSITMYLDCGEYYLNKTGKDTRTIAMSLGSPPMKIGMALGGSIGLYLLSSTGYVPGFTPDAAWQGNFMMVCWILPAIVYLASAILLAVGYKITDSDAAKYAQENAERAAQK